MGDTSSTLDPRIGERVQTAARILSHALSKQGFRLVERKPNARSDFCKSILIPSYRCAILVAPSALLLKEHLTNSVLSGSSFSNADVGYARNTTAIGWTGWRQMTISENAIDIDTRAEQTCALVSIWLTSGMRSGLITI